MKMTAEEAVLRRMGIDFTAPAPGCCGMAGAFGFEKEKYDISRAIGELELLPAVRQAPTDWLIVADGFSCREQIAQETDRHALHLAEVLQMALREVDRKPRRDSAIRRRPAPLSRRRLGAAARSGDSKIDEAHRTGSSRNCGGSGAAVGAGQEALNLLWTSRLDRLSLPQEHPDAVGCPRGYTAAEEIRVFRPDWTPKGKGSGQHWPVLGIPTGQSLPRLSFELAIHLASNQFHQTAQGAQECERLFWIAAALDDKCRKCSSASA